MQITSFVDHVDELEDDEGRGFCSSEKGGGLVGESGDEVHQW
jgi:hypothetical protein